jgi:hypothetical protein
MYQKVQTYLFRAQAPQLNVFGSVVNVKSKHEAQAKLQELNITLNERTKPPRLYMIIHPIHILYNLPIPQHKQHDRSLASK